MNRNKIGARREPLFTPISGKKRSSMKLIILRWIFSDSEGVEENIDLSFPEIEKTTEKHAHRKKYRNRRKTHLFLRPIYAQN